VCLLEQTRYRLIDRPSYVLGGPAMAVVYNDDSLAIFMKRAREVSPEHPVFLDRSLDDAVELDVDCLSDGTDVWIGGVQQHIEEAGIHSGDSYSVLPPWKLTADELVEIKDATRKLARALSVRGLMNTQFAIQ